MQCIPLMKVNTIVQGNHGNSGYVVLQASESQNNLAMIKTSGHWIEVFNFSAISHGIVEVFIQLTPCIKFFPSHKFNT